MIYNLALLGNPVEHSLSPQIHNKFFQKVGLKGGYLCIQTPSEKLLKSIRDLQDLGFRGANLTIPHKEDALEMADWVSAEAQLIGATNTLIFESNNVLRAENTDWIGFLESLPERVKINTKHAALLGAGGSAKAVLVALLKLNVQKIYVLVRSAESSVAKAQGLYKIVQQLKPKVQFYVDDLYNPKENYETLDLIINTTPVGMHGHSDGKCPVDKNFLQEITKANCHFYDLVYNPAQTPFLSLAEEFGFSFQNGYRMLELQAAHAFSLWTGVEVKKLFS
jgi:shikimate dehydrogenase